MPKLAAVLGNLSRSQEAFLQAAHTIPDSQWSVSPKPGTWSAAEVVAHLIMVETTVISTARRLQNKEPRKFPPWKRLHLPLLFVELRLARRKSPIPLDPQLIGGKESMLGALGELRERTRAFLIDTKHRDWGAYFWPHPFLGNMNAYSWFGMIAAHQLRHTKQMREIAYNLPKSVTASQK